MPPRKSILNHQSPILGTFVVDNFSLTHQIVCPFACFQFKPPQVSFLVRLMIQYTFVVLLIGVARQNSQKL